MTQRRCQSIHENQKENESWKKKWETLQEYCKRRQQEYLCLQQQNETLLRKLNFQEGREMSLRRSYDAQTEELKNSRKAQLFTEEKYRRQAEMLDESRVALDTASQANTSLAIKQLELQKWIPCLDDDEIRQALGKLYQGLERWVNSNFPNLIPGRKARDVDFHNNMIQPRSCFDTWLEIHGVVSHDIFNNLLCRTLVAIEDSWFSQNIGVVDERIREICPAHVSHQWRSATSTAISSLFRENLEANCKQYAAIANEKHAQYSPTEAAKRISQLEILMMKFADLKAKLECQADRFYFEWFPAGTPFCEVRMASFTGERSRDALVGSCLAPALFKVPSEGGHVLIRQATVLVRAPPEFDGSKEDGDGLGYDGHNEGGDEVEFDDIKEGGGGFEFKSSHEDEDESEFDAHKEGGDEFEFNSSHEGEGESEFDVHNEGGEEMEFDDIKEDGDEDESEFDGHNEGVDEMEFDDIKEGGDEFEFNSNDEDEDEDEPEF
ncbi:hypothetical protein N7466_006563 [Penicillium verhagenii]|uniref:uncharacterized protein n=1 Tax=Penicillium verhagenii TaxID=1562060 RepID=UPI002544F99E|nr:uncharacterized protein N7466_006563 [Penicillium verhagenii]KAJ5931070.1 hypothetical protein N7466_006563 [Penicillium verhagenii]